jgi:hypothetical protein
VQILPLKKKNYFFERLAAKTQNVHLFSIPKGENWPNSFSLSFFFFLAHTYAAATAARDGTLALQVSSSWFSLLSF